MQTKHILKSIKDTHRAAWSPLRYESLDGKKTWRSFGFAFFSVFSSPEKIWGGSIVHLYVQTPSNFTRRSHTICHVIQSYSEQSDTFAHDQCNLSRFCKSSMRAADFHGFLAMDQLRDLSQNTCTRWLMLIAMPVFSKSLGNRRLESIPAHHTST